MLGRQCDGGILIRAPHTAPPSAGTACCRASLFLPPRRMTTQHAVGPPSSWLPRASSWAWPWSGRSASEARSLLVASFSRRVARRLFLGHACDREDDHTACEGLCARIHTSLSRRLARPQSALVGMRSSPSGTAPPPPHASAPVSRSSFLRDMAADESAGFGCSVSACSQFLMARRPPTLLLPLSLARMAGRPVDCASAYMACHRLRRASLPLASRNRRGAMGVLCDVASKRGAASFLPH